MIYLSLALSSLFLFSNNQIALGFINTPPILHNNNKHKSAKKSRWTSYTGSKYSRCISYTIPTTTKLLSSPLDDFLGSIFGKDDDTSVNNKEDITDNNTYDTPSGKDEDINEISLSSFQNELAKRSQEEEVPNNDDDEDENEEFDGYALRDCIFAKYGVCFDLEFQRVDSYGFRTVYLVSCVQSMSRSHNPHCLNSYVLLFCVEYHAFYIGW